MTTRPPHRRLTPREFEIFILRGQCHRAKIIAAKLGINQQTVRVHLQNIHRKTGLRTSDLIVQYVTRLENVK